MKWGEEFPALPKYGDFSPPPIIRSGATYHILKGQ